MNKRILRILKINRRIEKTKILFITYLELEALKNTIK